MNTKHSISITKFLSIGFTIILLIALQFVLYQNTNLESKKTEYYSKSDIVNPIKAHLFPINISKLRGLDLNDHYDILIEDQNGREVYWNNNDKGLKKVHDFVSNQGTYNIYVAKTTSNKIQFVSDRSDSKYGTWISLILLLTIYFSILNVTFRIENIDKKWGIMGYSSIILLTAIFIYLDKYCYLPEPLSSSFNLFSLLDINLYKCIILSTGASFILNLFARSGKRLYNDFYSAILSSTVITSCFYLLAAIISGVINHEIITTNLNTPLQYDFKGVVFLITMLYLSGLTFYTSLILHNKHSKGTSIRPAYYAIGGGVLISLGIVTYLGLNVPLIPIAIFTLSYLLILDLYLDQSRKTAVFVFLWLIIYAGFIASVSFSTQLKKDINDRSDFVNSLYTKASESTTNTVKKIDNTIRNSVLSSQLATLPYSAKLDRSDITSYIRKQFLQFPKNIDIDVEAYDALGVTIFKNHFSQEDIFKTSLSKSDRLSKYIYYNPIEAKYLLDYHIENNNYITGPLRLIIVLTDSKYQKLKSQRDYNYYILKNKSVLAKSPAKLPIPLAEANKLYENKIFYDHSFVVYNPVENIQIGSYQKIGGLIKPISLFSFIITLCGFLLFLVGIANSKFNFLPSELDFSLHFNSSLKNKIQYTIIALIIFSFILIGLMTILYFKNVIELKNKRDKEVQITSIINDINLTTSNYESDGQLSLLQHQLTRLSHVHQRKLNLYNNNGQLISASYKNPSELRIPFDLYIAYNTPNNKAQHLYSKTSNGSSIHYIPLFSDPDMTYGSIGVLENKTEIDNFSLLDFLSTILNVYIFLFLVAGAIAIAISNSITKPLTYLSSKLRQFKLGKYQEKLNWSSNDEIGSLINSYNELTSKLEESANIIAKTERDTAWREMAKQVAHEIKNPLTPMKLSIQHLQRMSGSDPSELKSRLDRISKTLLEQFNNLDNIANSFSNFASMPTASNEKLILNEVVESVHDLFRKRDDILITLSEPITDLYIYADRNHVVRVLNNIVKNAIQSIPNDRHGEVHIGLTQEDSNALIEVKDNGIGIPDHMKDKVFTPNFTTKNSGTGLGLAISANMIEAFNGRIFFETAVGKGTRFYIEIPLMRLDKNFGNNNRVILD